MMGRTHVAVGVTALLVLICKNPDHVEVAGKVIMPAIGMISVAAGSLGPDCDIHGSAASKKIPLLSKMLTHRGITHTLLVPAILYALLYSFELPIIINSVLFGFLFGWVMHIAVDLLNRKGVPLFWPLYTSKVHIMCIKTNTYQEFLFLVVWCGICAIGCAYNIF